ncbi:MAG: rhodanese-like domain-containing protein [Firmicutes bacterium]|nr:rhodanese-like domain-containing protein [Bacillota bacterium]
MKRLVFVFILVLVFMCGCSSDTTPKVVKVNKDKAMELMNDGALLVDVRSLIEYNQGHIDKAINIDVQDILNMTDSLVYENANISKDKKIIVYCRSGSRSSSAASKLIELGYKNVYDLGSIDNWN